MYIRNFICSYIATCEIHMYIRNFICTCEIHMYINRCTYETIDYIDSVPGVYIIYDETSYVHAKFIYVHFRCTYETSYVHVKLKCSYVCISDETSYVHVKFICTFQMYIQNFTCTCEIHMCISDVAIHMKLIYMYISDIATYTYVTHMYIHNSYYVATYKIHVASYIYENSKYYYIHLRS